MVNKFWSLVKFGQSGALPVFTEVRVNGFRSRNCGSPDGRLTDFPQAKTPKTASGPGPAGDRPFVTEWDRSGAQNPRGIAHIQDPRALCRYCREGFEHSVREAKSSRPMPEANCCRR